MNFDRVGPFETVWKDRFDGNRNGLALSPPVCEHGLLIVSSTAGRFALFNRFTGDTLAEFSVENVGEDEGDFSAAVHGHTLIAAGGRSVTAFDLFDAFRLWEDGRFRLSPKWSICVEGGALRGGISLLPLQESNPDAAVTVCTFNGVSTYFHLFRLSDGAELARPVAVSGEASALVAGESGDGFFVSQDQRVYRLDAARGLVEPSATALKFIARLDLAPCWKDNALYFFDTEGALCACYTKSGALGVPGRTSDATLQVVTGFAVSNTRVLVSCSRGLAVLSRSGTRHWVGDGGMDACGSPPVIVGDVGFGVGQNRSVLYACDMRSATPRYLPHQLDQETTLSAPAYAEGVLYLSSPHGEISCLRVGGE